MAGTADAAARYMAPETLVPWAKNPRQNDGAVAQIAKSIERFGFASPIVARAADLRVIAGHTRLRAALQLGLERVPVRLLDISEAEADALTLADNRLGEIADWDDGALAQILSDLQGQDVDLDGLGWDDDDLAGLIESLDPPPQPFDEVPLPSPQVDVYSVAGEVYQLGPHRLICGSCRDPETVAKLLDGREINVAFTSPPYASQRKYDESSGFKPIAPDDFSEWFDLVQSTVKSNLAADGSWFVNIKAHCEDGQRSLYVMDLALAHVRDWGWRLVDELCWRRKAPPGRWPNRLRNDWEPVFQFDIGGASVRHSAVEYASESVPTHGGDRSDHMEGHWNLSDTVSPGMAHRGNVLDVAPSSHGGHTAGFPVGLPRFFIKAFSDKGDAIFDPFLGSGTTLIAAAELGRIGYGCEISPMYCDIIRRRWTRWATDNGHNPGSGSLAP